MGDELEIRSGGVVAVDTAELRAASARLRRAGQDAVALEHRLERAIEALPLPGWIALPTISTAARSAAVAAGDAQRLAGDLDTLADVYEYAELDAAALAARLAGDAPAAARLRARADALASASPGVADRARAAREEWLDGRDDGLADVSWRFALAATWSPVTALALLLTPAAATGLIEWAGRGPVPAQRTLGGPAPRVRVTPLAPAAPTTAPTTLAAAVGRVPTAAAPRVRVESYAMPDGSRQHVAYITGTKQDAPGEAFDWDANVDVYLHGEQGTAVASTRQALEQAGVAPGDRVHLVGHSQGAMVATHVAMDSPYDVATLVTVGSPVQGEVGAGTLSVALRHADDVVSALAGGGFADGVGAPGSFVAERSALSPGALPGQWLLGAHDLDRYVDTAAMLDRSADPRMDAVRERLAELGAASSVTVVEYSATAVAPGGAGASPGFSASPGISASPTVSASPRGAG